MKRTATWDCGDFLGEMARHVSVSSSNHLVSFTGEACRDGKQSVQHAHGRLGYAGYLLTSHKRWVLIREQYMSQITEDDLPPFANNYGHVGDRLKSNGSARFESRSAWLYFVCASVWSVIDPPPPPLIATPPPLARYPSPQKESLRQFVEIKTKKSLRQIVKIKTKKSLRQLVKIKAKKSLRQFVKIHTKRV